MAFITADIKISETYTSVATRLYFPTDLPPEVGNKVRGVITLLHGLGNSPDEWFYMTAACRYAADNGFALVVPDYRVSFGLNPPLGTPWHTILTGLLPEQLHRIFKLPNEREKNFIAGLSMGGYAALLLALRHPERYAAAGSFSGAVDMRYMAEGSRQPGAPQTLAPVLGPGFDVPDDADLFKLAERAAALPEDERPRLWCSCGAQDANIPDILTQNRAFRDHVSALPLDYTYAEWDGVHEWNFWDRSLAEFIGFVTGGGYGARKRGDWAAPHNPESREAAP